MSDDAPVSPPSPPPGSTLSRGQWLAVALITAGALALYVVMRLLPTGTNLSHMDFRVTGQTALELCDPTKPQFIPVAAVQSPVQLALEALDEPGANRPIRFRLTMTTASGKPVAPEDLLVAHTRRLHLLVIDPTLNDYHHEHPEPGRRAGEWLFELTPSRPGAYMVFADFVPAATGRPLYASTSFTVPGLVPRVTRETNWTHSAGPYRYTLTPLLEMRAGLANELRLSVRRPDAKPIRLAPVMDAFAHLVAFDERRSGFAHLHPAETDLSKPPDPAAPDLTFRLIIPEPGRYVIWSQFLVDGREEFVPFWFDVLP